VVLVSDGGGPRILVLLAARNGSRWITEQIESILAQTEVSVRIVVGDDCSTDDTREQVARFEWTGRVALSTTGSPAGSAAQNFRSLIQAHGAEGFDYVAFADQDDVWNPDKLRRACESLRSGAFAGYSSAVMAVWEDGRSRILSQLARTTDSDFLFEGAGQGCTFVLQGAFYRKAREFLGQHPELTRAIHYHDWTLYALARVWELQWCFDPRPSMRYRQHEGNDTGARWSPAGVRKRLQLIADRWYAAQIQSITLLCLTANPAQPAARRWHQVSTERSHLRRLRMARFCLRGGRRKVADNAILILAALAGWI